MEKYNTNVLAEAKQEYTRQLVNILYPQIYLGIKSIYSETKNYCEKHDDTNVLKKFQNLLSVIPKWNTDRINDEYKRIVNETDCDWIEDLITAVFVSHTKVLTSIKVKKNSNKNVELDVPSGPYFVHKCYTEVARNFWKRPYLFYHEVSNIEQQRNMAEAENCVKESIVETVRKLLPVKHILKEYLGGNYEDEDVNEDITSIMSTTTKNNLRKLVKAEIENTLKSSEEQITSSEPPKEDEKHIEDGFLPHPDNIQNKTENTIEKEDNQDIALYDNDTHSIEKELSGEEENKEIVVNNIDSSSIVENKSNDTQVITMEEKEIEDLEKFQEQLDNPEKSILESESLVIEDRDIPKKEQEPVSEPEIKMVVIQPVEKNNGGLTKQSKKQTTAVSNDIRETLEKSSGKSNRD